jgi:hypothetical protein
MVRLQYSAQSFAPSSQVDPDRNYAGSEDRGNFANRMVGVIEKD